MHVKLKNKNNSESYLLLQLNASNFRPKNKPLIESTTSTIASGYDKKYINLGQT